MPFQNRMAPERLFSFLVITTTTLIYLQEATAQTSFSQNRSAVETILNQPNIGAMHTIEDNKFDHNRSLKRVGLSNRTITCNDGSHAGFYLRKNPNSKKWIVFLEGGWHCYDTHSCRSRWLRLRHLMTSAQWPETRDVGGILSSQADENPYWHNANHVLVPYCSSDSWSGTRSIPENIDNWRFMGALIIRQVIADLIPLGLGRGTGSELFLAGSSAGGLGVMLNLDRVKEFLFNERKLHVTVRGVSDSGWFLDREPYTPASVASSESVRRGWRLWQGLLPKDCVKNHVVEPWRCYFGYRLYPTLRTPLFVFQWLFDEAQIRADNVGAPVTPQQWNYIHEMGGALRSSLDNVTAVFAPSCIGHAVLSKRDWVNIKIDDISLPTALRCWEHSTRQRCFNKLKRSTEATTLQHQNIKRHRNHRQHNRRHRKNNIDFPHQKHILSSQEKVDKINRKQNRQKINKRRNNNNSNRNHKKNNEVKNENVAGSSYDTNRSDKKQNTVNDKYKRLRERKRKCRRKQHIRHTTVLPLQENSANIGHANKKIQNILRHRSHTARLPQNCAARLLERCSWPQCNHSCPTLTNPLTGEEVRFLELLTSFGLDIEAVAAALGVDMNTLNNMDRTELVNLLTQQAS